MKERTKQLIISVPLLVIGVSAMGAVFWDIAKIHERTQKIDLEIARQREIAAEISRENAALKKTIEYLKSEEAQKFTAQKLGYSEDGQNVASVKDIVQAQEELERAQRAQDKDETQVQAVRPHWKLWWDIFFGSGESYTNRS